MLFVVAVGGDGGNDDVQVFLVKDFVPVYGVDFGVIGKELGVVEFREGVGASGKAVGEEGVFFGGFVTSNGAVKNFLKCMIRSHVRDDNVEIVVKFKSV